ncbi:MAG: hypothetical protein ACK505_00540 [Flavobacteriales bacterium]|jgi:hypothetical protein
MTKKFFHSKKPGNRKKSVPSYQKYENEGKIALHFKKQLPGQFCPHLRKKHQRAQKFFLSGDLGRGEVFGSHTAQKNQKENELQNFRKKMNRVQLRLC